MHFIPSMVRIPRTGLQKCKNTWRYNRNQLAECGIRYRMKTNKSPEMIDRLKRYVIHADSLAEVDADKINALVDRDAFACVRGLFSAEEIQQASLSARAGFSADRDNPAIGERPESVMSNYQKIAIGGAGNHCVAISLRVCCCSARAHRGKSRNLDL